MGSATDDPDDLFDLSGLTVVVTGGSRGLGLAMSRAFAARGAQVVIASRKPDVCAAAAADIASHTGSPCISVGYHAGRWDDAAQLTAFVYERLGGCDVLVNNAGIAPRYESLGAVTEELFDKIVAVNFKGPFRLSSLIEERMVAAGGGSILNVSSIAAIQPPANDAIYAGAKAAINNMTVSLARAFGPVVRVNALMPGPFHTDLSRDWNIDAGTLTEVSDIPMRRVGTPPELVGAAVYLASKASSFTTGSVLKVDGGWA